MESSFGQASTWLTGAAAQQTDLQRAVAAGELWMETGVAERAAARCDHAVALADHLGGFRMACRCGGQPAGSGDRGRQ